MKYFVASDIHGDSYWAERVVSAFKESKADKLVLLGDILYHGPRNDLPAHYEPKKVIEILNNIADRILAVRGNCDTEVDQMVLKFPILADYIYLVDEGIAIPVIAFRPTVFVAILDLRSVDDLFHCIEDGHLDLWYLCFILRTFQLPYHGLDVRVVHHGVYLFLLCHIRFSFGITK